MLCVTSAYALIESFEHLITFMLNNDHGKIVFCKVTYYTNGLFYMCERKFHLQEIMLHLKIDKRLVSQYLRTIIHPWIHMPLCEK